MSFLSTTFHLPLLCLLLAAAPPCLLPSYIATAATSVSLNPAAMAASTCHPYSSMRSSSNADTQSCPAKICFKQSAYSYQSIYSEHNLSSVHGEPASAGASYERLAIKEDLDTHLSVVLVLDPCFGADYEAVPVTGLTKAGLLPWVAGLTDALTATDASDGQPLQVSRNHQTYSGGATCTSYAECVADALREDAINTVDITATNDMGGPSEKKSEPVIVQLPTMMIVAFHMTQFFANVSRSSDNRDTTVEYMLPANRLRFTTVESFFGVAEATAAASALEPDDIDSSNGTSYVNDPWPRLKSWPPVSQRLLHQEGGLVSRLAGSVMILPRWVPLVNDRTHASVTNRFGDPAKWAPALVLRMATYLLEGIQVKPVPALEEWAISADKLSLQAQWRAGYAADPEHGTPLLEMVPVEVPLRPQEALDLCWSSEVEPSEVAIEATMEAIFRGIQALHVLIPPGSEERSLAIPEDPVTGLQSYIMKRMFSEASSGLTLFDFPSSIVHQVQEPESYKPWLKRNSLPLGDRNATGGVRLAMVQPLQHLRKAALHALQQGCGCKWLLQFKIKDFALTEYSVYLIGGADASPENTWVVYKPTLQGHNAPPGSTMKEGVGLVDIPRGHFANELVPHWGSSKAHADTVAEATDAAGELPPGPLRSEALWSFDAWRGRSSWPSPKMYETIVQAGLNGARAIAGGKGQDGRLLRPTLQHTFIRVDVGIFMPWNETSGRHEIVPRINELGWVNDASMMGACWNSNDASPAAGSCYQKLGNRSLTADIGCSSDCNGNSTACEDTNYNDGSWQTPCTGAAPKELQAAIRASQGSSLAAAYAKVLLQQVAWTALAA